MRQSGDRSAPHQDARAAVAELCTLTSPELRKRYREVVGHEPPYDCRNRTYMLTRTALVLGLRLSRGRGE